MSDPQKPPSVGDFPTASEQDWRKLVDALFKGAPFARLESKTYDGLPIPPLADRAADAVAIPGRPSGRAWAVLQRADHPDPAAANAQARDDLDNGATGLTLVIAGSLSADGFGLDGSTEALARLFDGIALDAISLDLDLAPFVRDTPQNVAAAIKQRIAPAAVYVRFGYDPITAAAMSGKMPLPWSKTAPLMAQLIHTLAETGFKGPFAVGDGRIIHNAGGSEAQELAFALSGAVAYLRALEASGMPLEAARDAIYFRFAADADQFLTMAKFRAARKLWARVEDASGLKPQPASIFAETAWRMMTKRDPYVNMLRSTIAVAAAGLGGADGITVRPHTAPLGLPDAFARRIARNTQLMLLEESNLARVTDPAAGSGAVGTLTQELCTAAWSLFQETEKAGGAWAALEQGLIQRNVAAVRAERQKAVARGKDVLTGTNGYPDLNELAPAVLDIAPRIWQGGPPAKPVIEALPQIRLAEPFERLRDKSDQVLAKTGARPKIFLATLGTAAEFTARANFARNFFEAGGLETVEGLPSPIAAFQASGAALACLCGPDKSYDADARAAAEALKAAGARHIYLAGRPGEREAALKTAGVQSFIYEGCDVVATLQAAYDILSSTDAR